MRNHPGLYRIGNGHAPPLIPSPPKSEKPGTRRLTELIPPFLDMVDGGRLAFNPAVELSYLSLENQTILFSIMERDELSPSLAQAQNLHKLSSLGKLDESAIEAILLTEPVLKKKVTLKVERIAPYFPRGTNPEEMEAVILRLLASWQRSREQKRAHENSERCHSAHRASPSGKLGVPVGLFSRNSPLGYFFQNARPSGLRPSDVLLAGAFAQIQRSLRNLLFEG